MRYFTKTQIRIIVALNLVIIFLLCGLFLVPELTKPVVGNPGDENHDRYRNARISLNVHLDFETNIGGSGDDLLVASFPSPAQDKIHIFGNTESSDYDLKAETGSIFFITTDRKGKIETLVTIGTDKDTLKKVRIADNGYLLAIEDSAEKKPYLIHMDYHGNILKTITHNTTAEESIYDLVLMPEGYLFVLRVGALDARFWDVRVLFYDLHLTSLGTSNIHHPSYSVEYVNVLEHPLSGKYILAANMVSDLWRGMGLILFNLTSTAQFTLIELENNYRISDFMPVSGGYVAMSIDADQKATLLTIQSASLEIRKKEYLAVSASSASLFFSAGYYYAFIRCTDKGIMKKYNASIEPVMELTRFNLIQSVDNAFVAADSILFACIEKSITLISDRDGNTKSASFGSGTESGVQIVKLGNELFTVSQTAKKSGDVGDHFGKTDLWLAKVSATF